MCQVHSILHHLSSTPSSLHFSTVKSIRSTINSHQFLFFVSFGTRYFLMWHRLETPKIPCCHQVLSLLAHCFVFIYFCTTLCLFFNYVASYLALCPFGEHVCEHTCKYTLAGLAFCVTLVISLKLIILVIIPINSRVLNKSFHPRSLLYHSVLHAVAKYCLFKKQDPWLEHIFQCLTDEFTDKWLCISVFYLSITQLISDNSRKAEWHFVYPYCNIATASSSIIN